MNAPDLHPEELLDRAATGALTDDERARLDQHLASCPVCRFEQRARADFQAAGARPHDVEDVVARALAGLPVQAQPPARAAAVARSARVLVAASVLLASMVSFAAVATVTGVLPRVLEVLTGASREDRPAPPAASPRREQAPRPEASPDVTPQPPEPEPVAVPAPVEAPFAALAPTPRPRLTPRAEASVAAEPTPDIPAAADVPDAGALFARANRERVEGRRGEAVKLYGELLATFPAAPEARVSEATLGRLLLDSGDPAAALVQLDAYLQSGDATLREEVLAARATALSRLNRPRDEAAAWSAFLQTYPDSVHAPRARARLSELEGL